MNIISWNLWCKNIDQIKSIEIILKRQPNIVCLQEVSLETVDYLKSLKEYNLILAKDFNSFKKDVKKEYFLVILSKYKIENTDRENENSSNTLTDNSSSSANVNKFSISHLAVPSIWDKINKWQESLEFQYADLEIDGVQLRVFNVHLEVAAGPKLRLRQFEYISSMFDSNKVNIICGDLNIYAIWWRNLLIGWVMGFTWGEYFLDERSEFEKKFKDIDLVNIFKDKATYPKYGLQLDHILIPKDIKVMNIEVMQSLNGSDHRIISADLDLCTPI